MRLARGRADGAVLVLGDDTTVARSFWAFAFCIPSVICRLLMTWVVSGIPAHAAHMAARDAMVFAIGWLIFVELTYRLAVPLGWTERWGRFIAVWNWCNVAEGVLIVAGAIPAVLGAPGIVVQVSALVTIGWALWVEWFGIRVTLGISSSGAAALVIVDQLIGVFLGSLAITLGS
jgi:hypothetical protein